MEEFNNWDVIAERYDKALSRIVVKAATTIKKEAQSLAPVDTGLLKKSIYTITFNSKGTITVTDKATGQKRTLNKIARSGYRKVAKSLQSLVFPELSVSLDDHTAYATVGAIYGAFVNYGTRFMAAQPFWDPALDYAQSIFEEELSAIEDQLGQDIEGSIEEE